MSSPLDKIIDTVKGAVTEQITQKGGAGGLLEKVGEAIGGRKPSQPPPPADVKPASQDPYGDPADQAQAAPAAPDGSKVKPASQDPYGDPADEKA